MPEFGDNPFDDGLDFVGCPPRDTDLILPDFPEHFKDKECKLIRWGRCKPVPDGEKPMIVEIDDFKRDPRMCSVYNAEVQFTNPLTGEKWYEGKLQFHYTRNYPYTRTPSPWNTQKSIAFRFVVKGDLKRVSDKVPENFCLILCTKKANTVPSYDKILVYGGLDIFCDIRNYEFIGYRFNLGHNDGWYTHHPNCSTRPINWTTPEGDYVGHYCDRGWLFVSPGRNFVFDSSIHPPTGRFLEEAMREIGRTCKTEEAIKCGSLDLKQIKCIHSYQNLEGYTECETTFQSYDSCQGFVLSGDPHSWITFFSMGYWTDVFQRREQVLHLVEGNIKVDKPQFQQYEKGMYFYGFATQSEKDERKLVDLASNKNIIGEPVQTELLLYLFNVGAAQVNPKLRVPYEIDSALSTRLIRNELNVLRDKELCPFLQEDEPKK